MVELSSMKTFILSFIILCFCNTLLYVLEGEKNLKMHCDSRYNTLFFVTRVTRDSRYTYSVSNITV